MRSQTPNLFQITSHIVSLARSGSIASARNLFDELPQRDSVAWNAMLTGYSQLGLYRNALSLFHCMRTTNVRPDHYSFTAALSASTGVGELCTGRKIHAQIIHFGCQSYLAVNNSLIDMYGKCLCPSNARRVFEEMGVQNDLSWCSLLFAYTNSTQFGIAGEIFDVMPNRVDFAWNIMISSHARHGEVEFCLNLFRKMRQTTCYPDQWTLSALMNACAESLDPCYGYVVHGYTVKSGWSSAVEVNNATLSFYAKQNHGKDAMKLFEATANLTLVSWNAMIDGHMKMGDTHKAFVVFQRAPEKNVVSWTSMITGYARNGHGEHALSFFVCMMRNCLQPDDYAFGAVLQACAVLAVLGHGKMVHSCILRHGFCNYVYIGNGLVNMYAKCGDMDGSKRAFGSILDKDIVSWNVMLFAFGHHGLGSHAMTLYEKMISCGVKPDKVTFIGLLMTCSHSGLIEKGQVLFKSMESVHKLSYEMDHVSCVIDMLGRGGYLKEARNLANVYSDTGAKNSLHESLLGACFAHGNMEIGTGLGEGLKLSEPYREMSYVLLSNLYCTTGHWREAKIIRKEMVEQGVRKLPGCSWIEIRNKVTAFVAGNHSRPYMADLRKMLYLLDFEMRNPCLIQSRVERI